MRILTLNCGSSTLKFAVLDTSGAGAVTRVATGSVERIGRPGRVTVACGQEMHERETEATDHAAAFDIARGLLEEAGCLGDIEGVGHRVVHGGLRFRASTRIDSEVVEAIGEVSVLAPLHNEPALAVIKRASEAFGPDVPAVAAFDTAYFAELPDEAALYAIPRDLSERYGIRRFGFHGLAHNDMVRQFQALLPEVLRPRLITLMLGGGCSVTASFDGRAVDTSMGYTPLEGLIMGTRSGDIDPALPLRLQALTGMSADEVEALLNTRSGLLGLSGHSGEMRDLMAAAQAGDENATFAVEMFCRSARKYVGAYLALLGGTDAVAFGGGIGENLPEVRQRICASLEWAGLTLDAAANDAATSLEDDDPPTRISTADSKIGAWVVRVDEAAAIARETVALLTVRKE